MSHGTVRVLLVAGAGAGAARWRTELPVVAGAALQLDQVSSLAAALDRLAVRPYDVALLELAPAAADGLTAVSLVQARFPALPLVVLSDAADGSHARQAALAGADDCLPRRHTTPEQLWHTLRFAIARRRAELGVGLDASPGAGATPGTHTSNRHAELVPGYTLVRLLGRGSMADVFLVRPTTGATASAEDALFALKLLRLHELPPDLAEQFRQRFVREAQLATSFRHPNLVQVLAQQVDARGAPYVVMEYVAGGTIEQRLGELSRLDVATRARLVLHVAEGLAQLHSQGVCHRDVKPANILVSQDLVAKLTDFGIARVPGSTITRSIMGSPAYMSPEAFSSMDLSPASDVFSLGVVAYELLLGKRPFGGENVTTLCREVRTGRPERPRVLQPALPACLERILARMLKKPPQDRYATAGELAADLRAFLAGNALPLQVRDFFNNRLFHPDWR